ncbi:hypothetical protein [Lacticaseibacillus manihotivorans]|uniref:hypothetical protein n=1 Tax=Lacticaseibacillus manihotivorans TaxID=88233 RepID=UPI000A416048|nr:hypothetical protein [Lacticaseibacillus manihotivorans]
MSESSLSEFPQGAFSAFSTAKMSHFLPIRPNLDPEVLRSFLVLMPPTFAKLPLGSPYVHQMRHHCAPKTVRSSRVLPTANTK